MQLMLEQPDVAPSRETCDLVVNVVCQDGGTAPHACLLLHSFGHFGGAVGRLCYHWWTFDVLASSSVRRLAQTTPADIVVVAAREGTSLPEAVNESIRCWLGDIKRPSPFRALVALLQLNPNRATAEEGVLRDLKHLAEAAGVIFFANAGELWEAVMVQRGGGGSVRQPAIDEPYHICQWPARVGKPHCTITANTVTINPG